MKALANPAALTRFMSARANFFMFYLHQLNILGSKSIFQCLFLFDRVMEVMDA